MTRRQPEPMRGRLDLRMTIEQYQELEDVADDLGVDVAVVARTALRLGVGPAHKQLGREIAEDREASSGDT